MLSFGPSGGDSRRVDLKTANRARGRPKASACTALAHRRTRRRQAQVASSPPPRLSSSIHFKRPIMVCGQIFRGNDDHNSYNRGLIVSRNTSA